MAEGEEFLLREYVTENRRALPVGRIINKLLTAKTRDLEALLSQRSHNKISSPQGSIEQALSSLENLVEKAANGNGSMDQILIPLFEHAVKFKGKQNCKKVVILLQLLCQNEVPFSAMVENIKDLLTLSKDHYIPHGWCVVVRALVEKWHILLEFSDSGIHDLYAGYFLKACCDCIPELLKLVHCGSIQSDGFHLPTRLSVAAADCVLICTQALTVEPSTDDKAMKVPDKMKRQLITPLHSCQKLPVNFEDNMPSTVEGSLHGVERQILLWNQIEYLISLTQQLQIWSRKSRVLHSKGLNAVVKQMEAMRSYHDSLLANEDSCKHMKDILVAAFSASWKHYSKLMVLENALFNNMFKQYLTEFISLLQSIGTGLQDNENKQSRLETRFFFLNCIALLIGRLDGKDLESTLAEFGAELLSMLFAQLQEGDDDVTEMAVTILREILFNSSAGISEGTDFGSVEMGTITPLLIDLLDERDSAARAVVLFIAEYFARSQDASGIQKLFECLDSKNKVTRRNAIDVIAELLSVCLQSGKTISSSLSENIARHLINRLGDEELTNRVHASNLFAQLDPQLSLPALVQLVSSRDFRIRSAGSDAIVAVLKGHNDTCKAVSVLLDCTSNALQSCCTPKHPGGAAEMLPSDSSNQNKSFDIDRIMQLIPKWSATVQYWEPIVEMVLEKMFAETSNSVIPRFLSEISDHLADVSDVVFKIIFIVMKKQQETYECAESVVKAKCSNGENDAKVASLLFARLSPLLVLRVLPLRAFNNLAAKELYAIRSSKPGFKNQNRKDGEIAYSKDKDCIAQFLMHRICYSLEFEDVQKLAAEITGKFHPQVILPLVVTGLERAVFNHDILNLKACLFTICNSIMLWGKKASLHQEMLKVRCLITVVLSWPSSESDEVAKAQHGCIDCLAFMICAELQISDSHIEKGLSRDIEKFTLQGNTEVLSTVLLCLKSEQKTSSLFQAGGALYLPYSQCTSNTSSKVISKANDNETTVTSLPFRLCMANVLISICQKLSLMQKSQYPNVSSTTFIDIVVPNLIDNIKANDCSRIRAACLQILFTVSYHLKSLITPYARDLFNLSIGSLKTGIVEEGIAGAKLMACLMASEEEIVNSIANELLEAKRVLATSSFINTSSELRRLCEKLLECVS